MGEDVLWRLPFDAWNRLWLVVNRSLVSVTVKAQVLNQILTCDVELLGRSERLFISYYV